MDSSSSPPFTKFLQAQRHNQHTNVIMLHRRPSRKVPTYPPPKPITSNTQNQSSGSTKDDDITPKANAHQRSASPTTTVTSSAPSMASRTSWRHSTNSSATDFDDLYDLSDDDSAVVPIKISNSVKDVMSRANIDRDKLPSLIIPSPSVWPTIQKLRRSATSPAIAKSPSTKLPLPRAAVETMNQINQRAPTAHSTPSLDEGGFTSDEPVSASPCPSTPDLRNKDDREDHDWDMPAQLPQQAMETLQQLAAFDFGLTDLGPIIEVPETQSAEMQDRGLRIEAVMTPKPDVHVTSEPCSGISIPSPGGFFASLGTSSKNVWQLDVPQEPPDSAAAESFYQSSYRDSSSNIGPHNGHQSYASDDKSYAESNMYRKSTIREGDMLVLRGDREYEYDETYEKRLHETASSNMTRTSMWLSAQELYLSGIKDGNPLNKVEAQKTPPVQASSTPKASLESIRPDFVSPSKKSVRFAEPQKTPPVTAIRLEADKNDPLFYHAFQHQWDKARPNDAFALRKLRADAIQAQRLYLPERHRAQLLGHFKLATTKSPAKEFAHLNSPPVDPDIQRHRDAIAKADREQQALQQITLSTWTVEAQRYLAGGHLLPRPARDILESAPRRKRIPRILDLAGQPTGDWGWAVALEHRDTKVYTAVPSSPSRTAFSLPKDWSPHRGPSNHRTLTVPNTWTLPFPANSIDIISARTLPSLLRTSRPATSTPAPALSSSHFSPPRSSSMSPQSQQQMPFSSDFNNSSNSNWHSTPPLPPRPPETSPSGPPASYLDPESPMDEYAATLKELHRVLAPGGILIFSLLDAELAASPTKTSFLSPVTPTDDDTTAGPGGGTKTSIFNFDFPSVPKTKPVPFSSPPPPSSAPPQPPPSQSLPRVNHPTQHLPNHHPTTRSFSAPLPHPPNQPNLHPPLGPHSTALLSQSVSFAISLRNMGYDPCAGARIGSRLTEAGFDFGRIRKTWVELPLGEKAPPGPADAALAGAGAGAAGAPSIAATLAAASAPTAAILPQLSTSHPNPQPPPTTSWREKRRPRPNSHKPLRPLGQTGDTGDITALIGSVAWERWHLAAQLESTTYRNGEGEGEEVGGAYIPTKQLEAIGRAIEGARAEGGVGWRVCVGWARK